MNPVEWSSLGSRLKTNTLTLIILDNIQHDTSVQVTLPDNIMIASNHSGQLPIPAISLQAGRTAILLNLKNASLILLGQLSNDNYNIFMNKSKLLVLKDKKQYYKDTETQMMVCGTSHCPHQRYQQLLRNICLQTHNLHQ